VTRRITAAIGLLLLGAALAAAGWFARNSELSAAEVLGCSAICALGIVAFALILAATGG
jgi:hypothetical protein